MNTDIDPKKLNLRRPKSAVEKKKTVETPPDVAAGPIGMFMDMAFNPSREKIREVTIIDRTQGRLLPQLDLVSLMWAYVKEIATYRKDSVEYERLYERKRPVPPDLMDEYMYRLAQWQKSIAGVNLQRAADITLAEMETKEGEDDEPGGGKDPWGDG